MPDSVRAEPSPPGPGALRRLRSRRLRCRPSTPSTSMRCPRASGRRPGSDCARRRCSGSSAAIILVLAVVIAFPGLFTDVDPNYKQLSESFNPPREGHPFGFTQQGGDVWARTLYGARASVAVGVLTTLLVAVVGIVTGAIAGLLRRLAGLGHLAPQRHLPVDPAPARRHRRHLRRQQPAPRPRLLGRRHGRGAGAGTVRVAADHPADARSGAGGQEPRVRRCGDRHRGDQVQEPGAAHRAQRPRARHRHVDDLARHLHRGGVGAVVPGPRPAHATSCRGATTSPTPRTRFARASTWSSCGCRRRRSP